jgi:hypothetical protein
MNCVEEYKHFIKNIHFVFWVSLYFYQYYLQLLCFVQVRLWFCANYKQSHCWLSIEVTTLWRHHNASFRRTDVWRFWRCRKLTTLPHFAERMGERSSCLLWLATEIMLGMTYRDWVCICNWTSPVNQSLAMAVLMSLCVIQKCSNYCGMRHVVGQGGDQQISLGKLHGKFMRYPRKIYHSNSHGTRQFHGLAPWLELEVNILGLYLNQRDHS